MGLILKKKIKRENIKIRRRGLAGFGRDRDKNENKRGGQQRTRTNRTLKRLCVTVVVSRSIIRAVCTVPSNSASDVNGTLNRDP